MKRSRTYDYIVCLRQAEWNTLALQDYSFREVITLDAPGFWERQGLVTQQFNTLADIPIWPHRQYLCIGGHLGGENIDHVYY